MHNENENATMILAVLENDSHCTGNHFHSTVSHCRIENEFATAESQRELRLLWNQVNGDQLISILKMTFCRIEMISAQ